MPLDDTPVNLGSVAPLTNVILFLELMERVMNRKPGLPGMATFHGPSGYGKSWAAAWAANKHRAYYVQIKSVWTVKSLYKNILKEMGIKPAASVSDMLDQVAEQLMCSGRPLIIDEADFLESKGRIEVVRDIYEASFAPIILIGEDDLPKKLKVYERVHGRMLDWVPAEPASLKDTVALATKYAEGVEIADDLLTTMVETLKGSTRRISISLDRIREAAETADLSRIDLAQWRALGGMFFTGDVPTMRRGA